MKAVRQAVIDIGSNTVRLVVYAGLPRAPLPIYNEKSRVKLGACLAGDGVIDKATMKKALAALARFETLAQAMQVDTMRVVATAATREAKNGHELVEKAAALGIHVDVLDGDAEATAAGLGILSDNPHANGYVGDLGGGSLELIRISDGKLGTRISLPLGTLRHDILQGKTTKQITQMLRNDIAKAMGKGNFPIKTGLPFYMIGGSWRTLARLHMHQTAYPLTILSNYEMPADAPEMMMPLVNDKDALTRSNVLAAGRISALPGANALLAGISGLLKPSKLVTSIYGLREGLLFEQLLPAERQDDPLIAAARFAQDEMGFEVVGMGTYSREFAREVRDAAKLYGVEALISDDYLAVEAQITQLQPELILGTQMERHIAKRAGIPCAVISAPVHVQDFPARYSPQMGFEGACVLFDTWVHPLMMGLEEHLIGMFRHDFEFVDGHRSHLGDGPPAAAPSQGELAGSDPAPVLGLHWSTEGEAELAKIPFFVRGKVRRNTEKYAHDRGIAEITVDIMYDAKAFYGR